MKGARKKLVYVQPLQTPYNTPRLAALAKDSELEVVVLLEAAEFSDRPGWATSTIPECTVEVIDSQLIYQNVTHRDLNYALTEVRPIPWRLPIRLCRLSPNIVVVSNATELMFALCARLFKHFRLVLNVEDTNHSTRHHSAVRAFFKGLIYRRADLHLAFSEQSERYLRTIGLTNSIARTSWSVNIDSFAPDVAKRTALRDQLNIEDKVVFLFVGRFVPLKGLLPMLRAWRELPSSVRERAALVLVGDGPLAAPARQFVRDHDLKEVHFAGQKTYEEVPAYFSAADLLILPTLQDVWGLVVLEAMASQLPVIASIYCGASYLVQNNVNGWLFDPAEKQSICHHLERAISASGKLAEMGAAAKRSVDHLDTARVMGDLASMLKRL